MPIVRMSSEIEAPAVVRPEIDALKQRAALAVRVSSRTAFGQRAPRLLLAETERTFGPSAIIRDPVLAPVDKIVWQLLYLTAEQQGGDAAMPPQPQLARIANVASTETVSKAITMLRCLRWLSACHSTWCQGDWRRSDAFILQGRPLSIVDTLRLDPHYPAFLRRAANQRHARVRATARGILKELSRQGHTLG